MFPHRHKEVAAEFPEENFTLASNYCRNGYGETEGPWCYTIDPEYRWGFCDVPWCGKCLDLLLENYMFHSMFKMLFHAL